MAHSATILGASGYSGAELLRLLDGHPSLQPVALAAGSRAGQQAASALPHVAAADLPELVTVDEALSTRADVCFSCLPSGRFAEVADAVRAEVVIDLSDDHRAAPEWTYGLTEFARRDLGTSARIANPGCYPTAVLLAALPFLRDLEPAGPLVVDALSGVSGAGRKAEDRLLFGSIDGGVAAYGTTSHRHVPEMERGFGAFAGRDARLSFTPHLAPLSRGLLATVRIPLAEPLDDESARSILRRAYEAERFVAVTDDWPSTKAVSGSNSALVTARVDERTGYLVASCAIDNLGKGAAGQAIQNANVALGLEETLGLPTLGVWP